MIQLAHARVDFTPDGCVSTFADGANYGAHPHDTAHYYVTAHRCGYGDDILTYAREHEVAHHLVGETFYGGPSPVLWELAHGREPSAESAALEEAMTMTLQRFVRAGERPMIGRVDWDALKRRFLEIVS